MNGRGKRGRDDELREWEDGGCSFFRTIISHVSF